MFTKSILTLGALAASASASCLHGTTLKPRSLNARAEVEVADFGYTALNGPANWAGLNPNENGLCSRGKLQSPINIDPSIGTASELPSINIPPVTSAEFENLASTVEVIMNGTTTFRNESFSLAQFHFHTPSEHRINDEYFPLEMHMVHQSEGGGIVVLGLLFQLDATNTPFLDELNARLEEVRTPGTVATTGPLDVSVVAQNFASASVRQYTGSLTTPPCSEGITFLISESPLPINVETYNHMKSVMKFNSRFTQNTPGADNLMARNGGMPTGF